MALLARAAERCDDATRLRRIVPYLVVRAAALPAPPVSRGGRRGRHVAIVTRVSCRSRQITPTLTRRTARGRPR